MKILHELSWLWETLGIALVAAAVCMTCAALICKAAKKKLQQKRCWQSQGRGICGRDSGGHSDCPDADAALIRQEAFAMDKGRYSIIFSSLTGNTKKLAETIRAVLPAEDCDYFGAPETAELHSEMLYVGFGRIRAMRTVLPWAAVKAERQKDFSVWDGRLRRQCGIFPENPRSRQAVC